MAYDLSDNEKELQLLYQGLKRARGFHLYLVQCNSPQLRAEILASLKQRLEASGITVYYHHMQEQMVSLNDFLPPGIAVREKEKAVLLVSGLENSFFKTGENKDILHRLNYARDLLPKKIPVPLVLWLPEAAIKKILTGAHDLWSWRSGTFYFSTPQEPVQSRFQEKKVLGEKESKRVIPEKLYKEQLVFLTGLLKDIKLRDDTEKTRLQKADLMQQISELHYSYAHGLLQPDRKRGILEKALELQIKALEIKKLIMGRDHPELARCHNNLSSIYQDLGQLDLALEFQKNAAG